MPTDPHSPALFGPYRIVTRIATGGMAEVYAARRLTKEGEVGPMVALKRLLPHLVRDPMVVRMFLNEARITEQIQHPNVVRILDVGHHGSEPYIAMQLLEGHSFGELRQQAAMQGERVPMGITLKVLADACRGLDAAHRAVDEEGRPLRIVHRDFTPDNIHVGVDGGVKVIDFGIAKSQHLGVGTEPGTLKGKFFYMSPEMISGQPVDHRADLYAAGVMLYEQLCGRRPFTGTSPEEILDRIALAKLRRPTEFDPSIPPALEAICLMALKREPELRFQTLDDFVTALESVGGAALVASSGQLAAYVDRLFPVERDERRAVLQQAREKDPSQPRAAPAKPPRSSPPRQPRPKRVGRLLTVALLCLLGLLAGGAGALWHLRERPSVEERLSQAEELAAPEERVRLLSQIAQDEAATEAQLERVASLLIEARAPAEALRAAEALLQRFAPTAAGRLLEARAAIALRQGKRAHSALEAARKLDPDGPLPDVVLAELRELQGDLHGAANALADALAKSPSDHALAVRHGYLLSQAGRLAEAEEALAGLLRRRFDPEAAAELAFVRYRQHRPHEALPLLRRALKARPKLALAHYYLGAVLFRQGDPSGAERAYLESERLAPDDPRPLVALCELHGRAGNAEALGQVHLRLEQRFGEQAPALKRQCGH